MDLGEEKELRRRIFERLDEEVAEKGSLTRDQLTSFDVDGTAYRLIDRNKGIWNPRAFAATVSILTKPDSNYHDKEVGESRYAYAYREGNHNGDNAKLRRAFELELPIIWLRWIKVGTLIRFVPVYPVYVVADDSANAQFILALDPNLQPVADGHQDPIKRAYAERTARQRLHQPQFRGRVLLAYETRCAVCNLGHGQLLDAAHIIGDTEERGTAEVDNGLCLCKIHHAAYDANLLGISPAGKIHIGTKLMADPGDSPTLKYALKEMDGADIFRPRRQADQPSPERLAERFADFEETNNSGATYDQSWPAQPVSVLRVQQAFDPADGSPTQ
ncbi:HNH endonuclease [Nocardia sp. NPDC050710]|uniref:HNH endonuclease n=1 Tax=Nocardia sp. NPDC050710 TaxID=3157220 RepID=UPI0033F61584